MMVVDESSRIKTPSAARTKAICKLGDRAKYRRILTGTPISNSPFDYYSQFLFLDYSILGQSYFAFKAQYADILPTDDPLVRKIMSTSSTKFAPQLVAKDAQGRPMYKNLDRLKAIIAPYSMRVTKEECLELPPKIYEKRYFKLDPKARKLYDDLKNKMKTQFADQKLNVMSKMTLVMRLQQVADGFIANNESKLFNIHAKPMDNPRMQCLMDTLEDIDGSVIIWCRFVEEIRQIAAFLGDDCYTYYGEVSKDDRAEAYRGFANGERRYFVGNATTGGIGLNLTQAATVIYYSNTFSYEDRKQSEDRAHRIGQVNDKVLYIDIEAEDTVDAKIISALHNKEDLATFMTDFRDFAV
jgi:SNF2 family DNA or RNA helicase